MMIEKVTCKGHYYWQLVFDYDNSNNSGTIVEEFELREKKIIDKKEFLKRQINVKNGFSLGTNMSYSIKCLGVSGDVKYNIHQEISKEYENLNETKENTETETVHKKSYTIGPNSKLRLFVLCFQMDGAFVKSGIVSTDPSADVDVFIDFQVKQNILGLVELENCLMHTSPSSYNKQEWEKIRNTVISASAKDDESRFMELVKILANTQPSSLNPVAQFKTVDSKRVRVSLCNELEWDSIRGTCGEILSDWNNYEKQLLFNKLLRRLSIINAQSNRTEWTEIRNVCKKILNNLVVTNF